MAARHGEAPRLRRIVLAGGSGFFGRTVAALLRAEGIEPTIPERSALDVEEPRSLRSVLRPGDVVIDAAGPFQARTTTLVEVALALGVDVIDLNESLGYAKRIAALAPRAAASESAVLSSCSAVSTVAAALVRLSGIERPPRVSALVAPASRETAHPGTLRALLASVGAPIEVWRDRRFARAVGWRESRRFALPSRRAYLVESVLSLDLPRLWPSLEVVDCWTDTSTLGANALLSLVSVVPALRRLALRALPLGALLARLLGTYRGAFALEVAGEAGSVVRLALTAARGSYRIAAAPAVLAARALSEGRSGQRGVVPPDRHVELGELLAYLGRLGIQLRRA